MERNLEQIVQKKLCWGTDANAGEVIENILLACHNVCIKLFGIWEKESIVSRFASKTKIYLVV